MPLFPSARPYAFNVLRNATRPSLASMGFRLRPTCEGATLGVKSVLQTALWRPRRCSACGMHARDQCKAQKGATKTLRLSPPPLCRYAYTPRRPRPPLAASACMPQVNCVWLWWEREILKKEF